MRLLLTHLRSLDNAERHQVALYIYRLQNNNFYFLLDMFTVANVLAIFVILAS